MGEPNPYPYEAKPGDMRITPLGWSVLTREEAERLITTGMERADA